jgi:Mn-dependent DtxR family transcriptional regulator
VTSRRKRLPGPKIHPKPRQRKRRPPLHESAIKALQLIRERGSVTSRDVSRSLGLSREHTARVMKSLHERGLVLREGKPFKYSLTPQGERVLREGSG